MGFFTAITDMAEKLAENAFTAKGNAPKHKSEDIQAAANAAGVEAKALAGLASAKLHASLERALPLAKDVAMAGATMAQSAAQSLTKLGERIEASRKNTMEPAAPEPAAEHDGASTIIEKAKARRASSVKSETKRKPTAEPFH